jgi:MSHA biogenesis protein MshQ
MENFMAEVWSRLLRWGFVLTILFGAGQAHAGTYQNASTPFAWIDASTHTKVGYNTVPYKFNQSTGCATTPPIIDDTLSDAIPIGFNFLFVGVSFNTLRIMSNGRLQFNNNVKCEAGSPVQQLPYPNTNLNYTMRIYGNDLDPTLKSDVTASTYNTNCLLRTACYISYATIGTAPNRSFVVTWNNVPEWTTGSNPTGSYNLQVILQENGEFIYQYGIDVPGPSATLGQTGWQADSLDYDTVATGFPANNSAVKFFIPRPVAEYRMEQIDWSVTQVLDTSGNLRHGSRLGLAQTTGAGKVCRGGNFPANTVTTTIDAISTPISIPTNVGGAGSITFWYKANTAWSGGGVQDAQLIDASVVNGQWFFIVRRSNGRLRFVITDTNGNVQVAETGAIAVAANTFKHIGVSWNFNALGAANSDHLRIYVDGVLQNETTFTSSGTVSAQIGTLHIGDNRSTFIGSSGTGNSTNGVIDEFRIYNYEGGLALIQRDYNNSSSTCVTHYAISHAGTGTTCAQTTITISAHDSTHANVIMPNNTTQISLSTTTGKGDWTLISGYGILTNGTADDGAATYLFNGEYQAVFGFSHTTTGSVGIDITDGQTTDLKVPVNGAEDALVVFSTCRAAGFNACELSAPRCTPIAASTTYAKLYTKLANTAFALDLVALKADGTLESAFSGSATVDLLVNTGTPITAGVNNCPVSQTATIPLGSIAFSGGKVSATGISFAANAISNVSPNYSAYRDARVRVTCDAANCTTPAAYCSTDNFAVRPTTFTLTSNMTNATQINTPSLNAGANFSLSTTAVAGYNGIPLIDNSLLGQKIATHVTVPLPATDYTSRLTSSAGSPIPIGTAAIATGLSTNATMNYDDVGNFLVKAGGAYDSSFTSTDQPNDCVVGSYSNTVDAFGKFGCDIANQANSALFGRFYPDYYAVNTVLSAACGPATATQFTYMGQAGLGFSWLATAYSKNNVQLTHYTAGYGTLATIAVTGDDNSGATSFPTLNTRVAPAIPAFSWNGGNAGRSYSTNNTGYAIGATVINVLGSGDVVAGDLISFGADTNKYTVTVGTTGSGPITIAGPGLLVAIPSVSSSLAFFHSFNRLPSQEGPYDAFAIKTKITDNDGALITKLNGATITGNNTVLSSTTRLRYGRLRIENAYGSELLPLPVKLWAEYWNGSSFVTNTLDNCTSLARANYSISGHVGGVAASNMTTVANIPANAGVVLVGGFGTIKLLKPNVPPAITTKGSFYLNSLIPYLPGSGRETLGVFKNAPIIYIREVY